jgi:ADP-heptose:LPS heptosyltransferase
VLRFSALGDVAMTVPVIKLLLEQNSFLHITFVSSDFVKPLFEGIERLQFHGIDVKEKHKGVLGLFKLFRELNSMYNFDAIADLHDVLRTKMLRLYFSFADKKISVINKGRMAKKRLTRLHSKELVPLKTTFQRYSDVFIKLNLSLALNPIPRIVKSHTQKKIGIAPFARHKEKMYPLEMMKEVVQLISRDPTNIISLFGSKNESPVLEQWAAQFSNVHCIAGRMSFKDELDVIKSLDVMLSMDSANMHLASLFGIPVVSVWGATHPFAGFYGWGQLEGNAVQVDLYCRPCSVFGNKRCYRGDWACLHSITPQTIHKKVMEVLYIAAAD